ncbi:MAG TPA: amidohydrolase family protein [Puia sp.]|nr:amidohydrolase family protein [Puia sp.]
MRKVTLLLTLLCNFSWQSRAQTGAPAPYFTPQVKAYIKDSAATTFITDVTIIDGTGGPVKTHQTIVMDNGLIRQIGNAGDIKVPAGSGSDGSSGSSPGRTTVLNGTGKTVIPGLVMLHEHLYYTLPMDNYFNVAEMPSSFPRMYLAGGVTTSRTTGSIEPQTDLALRRMIGEGKVMGPDMDVTAPYIERAGFDIPSINIIKDTAEAATSVNFWADKGCTSFKMYMHITRGDLRNVVREAHKRGLKVTGHLCSVTFREAAEIGIDDLEHGFMASSDFDSDKKPDSFDYPAAHQALQSLPVNSPKMKSLIELLVSKHVALTSTLPVFEPVTGREMIQGGGEAAVLPQVKEWVITQYKRRENKDSAAADLFRLELAWEKQFYDAGGLLVAGTDPTGSGRTIAGYANYREIELLVEGGFTITQAIRICTLNGALYLGREKEIGTLAPGKHADLVLINGDLSQDIRNIRKTEIVFKNGVGFDSQKIFASVKEKIGIN